MAHFRPILSVIEPAIRDELILITALMEIKLVIVVKGSDSSSPMYMTRKGQIMLIPVVLTSIPQNKSQNWDG